MQAVTSATRLRHSGLPVIEYRGYQPQEEIASDTRIAQTILTNTQASRKETHMADNAYDQAEEGWKELIAAADKIQDAANKLKKSDNSIDGYNIERAIIKHKPELMKQHLDGLQAHRRESKR